MNQMFRRMKGKWKWGLGIVSVLVSVILLITLFQAQDYQSASAEGEITITNTRNDTIDGSYKMRSRIDTWTASAAGYSKLQWETMDTTIVDFPQQPNFKSVENVVDNGDGTTSTEWVTIENDKTFDGNTVRLEAKQMGMVSIILHSWKREQVDQGDGTTALQDVAQPDITITLEVGFTINEAFLTATDENEGVTIQRVNSSAERNSIIMEMGSSVEIGTSAETETDKVNVIVGSARASDVTWASSNVDVVDVNGTTGVIRAVGVGRTKLTVIKNDGIDEKQDEIYVYVRPQARYYPEDTTAYAGQAYLEANASGEEYINLEKLADVRMPMKNGDVINIPNVIQTYNGEEAGKKIQWAIERKYQSPTGQEIRELVKDSEGNGAGGASLAWVAAKDAAGNPDYDAQGYTLNAEAGEYSVYLFTYGTYESFDKTIIEYEANALKCNWILFRVRVGCDWGDKDVTLNVGGKYDLASALGIKKEILADETEFTIDLVESSSMGVVTQDNDDKTLLLTNTQTGYAIYQVTRIAQNKSVPMGDGTTEVPTGQPITIRVNVGQTIQITTSNIVMYKGQTLALQGVFDTGNFPDGSEFSWDVAFKNNTTENPADYLTLTYSTANPSQALSATATALKETTGNALIVTLTWTVTSGTSKGVVQSTKCEIVISPSTSSFSISGEDPLYMSKGDTQHVTLSSGDGKPLNGQNFIWTSSDENIFTIDNLDQNNPLSADIKAGQNVGTAVLLVMNPENHVTVTCTVIVTQKMTKIEIYDTGDPSRIKDGQGEANLAEGFLDLGIKYEPADATSTAVKWLISGEAAKINENGRLELLDAGSVVVTAIAADDSSIIDACTITIITTKITGVTLNTDKVNIIKGDTYDLEPVIAPENPADKTLHWHTMDEKIATVDENGVVTGVNIGTTTVTVIGGWMSDPVAVTVNVRDRLQSISFEHSEYTIEMGQTLTPNVIFNPDENVNKNLVFASSNEDIATVDRTTGLVTGVAIGDVMIMAEAEDPIGADKEKGIISCMVHVIKPYVEAENFEVSPTQALIRVGEFFQLETKFTPEDTTDQTVVYTTSQEGIVEVNPMTGIVTGIGEGRVVVSVTAVASGKVAICYVEVDKAYVEAEEFAIDPTMYTLRAGETFQITAKFTPEDTTDQRVAYASSNDSVATADGTGLVTAAQEGLAVITATAVASGKVATCLVVVQKAFVPIQGFEISPHSQYIRVGDTFKIETKFIPEDATNQEVTYRVSDETIAAVSPDGIVSGLQVGVTVVFATSVDTGIVDSCTVTVDKALVEAEAFAISPTEQTIREGENFRIEPKFTPEDTTDQTVQYVSSNDSIATIDAEGNVTGVAKGTAVITATAVASEKSATCVVTVKSKVEFSLSPATKTLVKGSSFKLTKVTVPAEADKTAVWKSSNTKIATVSSTGKVTAKKTGSCKITCKLTKYNVSAKCTIKVVALKSSLSLDKKSIRINVGQTYRLKKTVKTNDTTKPSVKYTSKNKKIASVGKTSGKIKGKKVGSTIITAKTVDAYKATAKCRVTVIRRVSALDINKSYAVCFVGKSINLKVTVRSSKATIKKLNWSSSDTSIAEVDRHGKVTGLATGEVRITAKTTDGSNQSVSCYVKVMDEVPTTSITVAQSKLTMKKGDSTNLSYTILPSNTTDSLKMASDNKRVATVTNEGKVVAVGTGTATITMMASGGVTSTVEVHVVDLNKQSVRIRQYDTETLVVTGAGEDDTITWYSANQRIATVEGGKVVGRAVGTTYVYAYVDGCKMACKVQVVSVTSKAR